MGMSTQFPGGEEGRGRKKKSNEFEEAMSFLGSQDSA